jgi:hypothetical protein
MAAASVDPNSASDDAPRRSRAHPSRRSLRGLDWFIFCLADVQVGFGAFVALYLTTQKWTQIDIGMVLSVAGLTALAGQLPGGAIVDATARIRVCQRGERPRNRHIPDFSGGAGGSDPARGSELHPRSRHRGDVARTRRL